MKPALKLAPTPAAPADPLLVAVQESEAALTDALEAVKTLVAAENRASDKELAADAAYQLARDALTAALTCDALGEPHADLAELRAATRDALEIHAEIDAVRVSLGKRLDAAHAAVDVARRAHAATMTAVWRGENMQPALAADVRSKFDAFSRSLSVYVRTARATNAACSWLDHNGDEKRVPNYEPGPTDHNTLAFGAGGGKSLYEIAHGYGLHIDMPPHARPEMAPFSQDEFMRLAASKK